MPIARRLAPALLSILSLLLLIPALASAAAELTAETQPVVFPDVGIDDPAQTASTKIVNNGDEEAFLGTISATGPFAIDTAGSDCDEIAIIGVGASCNLAISFDPQEAGPAGGEVTIAYSSEFSGGATLAVLLSGLGVAGTLQANQPSFNAQPYFYGGQQQQMSISNNSAYTAAPRSPEPTPAPSTSTAQAAKTPRWRPGRIASSTSASNRAQAAAPTTPKSNFPTTGPTVPSSSR